MPPAAAPTSTVAASEGEAAGVAGFFCPAGVAGFFGPAGVAGFFDPAGVAPRVAAVVARGVVVLGARGARGFGAPDSSAALFDARGARGAVVWPEAGVPVAGRAARGFRGAGGVAPDVGAASADSGEVDAGRFGARAAGLADFDVAGVVARGVAAVGVGFSTGSDADSDAGAGG